MSQNTCPQCQAPIPLNYQGNTCQYCQSPLSETYDDTEEEYAEQDDTSNEQETSQPSTPNTPTPARAKFMSAAGKFVISLVVFMVSGALLDTVDEKGIAYKILVLGTFGGMLASIVFIIYTIFLAIKLSSSEE